jgi:SnoaL-like domain
MTKYEETMSDLTNLELRLQRVEDQLELLRLEGAYAYFYDRDEGQAWAALFTEDGVYSGRQLAGMGEPNFIQGRANLAKFCQADRSSCVHMLHLPHFAIDGDTATARILVQHRGQFIEHGRPTQTQATGCYDVTYRRTGEGWRIHRRVNTFYERQVQIAFGFEPSIPDIDVPPRPKSGEYPYRDRRG